MELRTHPAPTTLGGEGVSGNEVGFDPRESEHVCDDLIVQYPHMSRAIPARLLDWVTYRLRYAGTEWSLHRREHSFRPWRHEANVVRHPELDSGVVYELAYDGQRWTVAESPRYVDTPSGTCDP